MNARGRATIHDVARLAGVSTATVSRVLSGGKPVTEETARRVHRAVERLDYRVDVLGRSLRQQKSLTIGLVVADITNPFFPALIREVETASQAQGYGVLIADAADDVERESASVDGLVARRVDALVIAPVDRRRSRETVERAAQHLPTIQLDRRASKRAHHVGMDNALAVKEIIHLLADSGRRSFAFVGSDPQGSTTWTRQQAFLREAVRFDPAARARILTGHFSSGWGRSAAIEISRRWPEVDAVICANDLIAVGVIDGLAIAGRRVPADAAVVGFDDTLLATLHQPEITSVRHPLAEMARTAIELIPAVGGPPDGMARKRLLRGTLIIRESSG